MDQSITIDKEADSPHCHFIYVSDFTGANRLCAPWMYRHKKQGPAYWVATK